MAINDTYITFTASDGAKFKAYIARPRVVPAPAVLVIQEIFGVNAWLRSVADWLAESGYLAVAPDLFFRLEPGVELTDKTEADWEKAFTLYKAFDENQGVVDLTACLQQVRQLQESTGKAGTLGFCLGGKLAFLMSTRSDAAGNVGYYGVGIENNLNEVVRQPLLLHLGESDPHVPVEAQRLIKTALKDCEQVSIHSYPGMDHAFGRPGSQHYNKEASELAHQRTLKFLAEHLLAKVANTQR